jgi:predicted PurR-regulated permease PerM
MDIVLMLCTILVVVLLVVVLVSYLSRIINSLNSIGGDGKSYLAKLRLGLRAIETETGHLPTEVTKLNETLSDTAGGLVAVNENLEGTIEAVLAQKV